jgi:hypothetical protein
MFGQFNLTEVCLTCPQQWRKPLFAPAGGRFDMFLIRKHEQVQQGIIASKWCQLGCAPL